jgi:hypothetical protein
MTKHTPGPWEVRDRFYIGRPGRMSLAEVKCGDVPANATDEHEANARLMASSPDLLAELRNLLSVVDNESRTWGEVDEARESARATIAKATGDTDAN